MRRTRLKVLLSLAAVVALAASMVVLNAMSASAVAFHGITPQKACNPTTQIGQPYVCSYQITNADDNNEDIVVTSLIDVVHSAGGNVSSGNIIGSVVWHTTGTAFCTGTPVTSCTLPNKGDAITSDDFTFYTVTAADYNQNAQHILADDISIAWSEPVCVNGGCPQGGQTGTTGASTTVIPFTPSITTLLSATNVDPGTLVHDSATLHNASADAGGTVSYAVYSDNTCTTLVQSLGTKNVTNGSVPDSDNWTAVSGDFWFQATYSGDASNIGPVSSVCTEEPIHVTSPGVSIVKKTNGADANDPNGADVPNIKPGDPVTWTYIVTNTGSTHVAKADVHVTDNTTGVTPTFSSEQSGNGDQIFDPGEVWIYTATGTALDLTQPPPAGTHTTSGCTHNNQEPGRTAYINLGTATIPGASDDDPSAYCNPPVKFSQNLTPGFWKNHQAATQALLPLKLGNHTVSTFAEAKIILSGMGCGKGADGPINCMAGMLLAAELNLAQGGNPCIQAKLDEGNALLKALNYNGFNSYSTPTAAQNAQALALHDYYSSHYNIDAVITSC
jgi:hypothetical protein